MCHDRDALAAGLDDCEAVTRWALANASRLGVAPERVAIAGESAGGNLAAAVALRVRGSIDTPLAAVHDVGTIFEVMASADKVRVRIFARRFAPLTCVAMDRGHGLLWDRRGWQRAAGGARVLTDAGEVREMFP